MESEYINITADNIADEHLCCIIRSKKPHPGVEAKRQWLSERIKEGHVFRKLNAKGIAFIEYAPLESAWAPVVGDGFVYIYCLWVDGAYKGKGHAKALMDYCLTEAKRNGKSGVCMLGATKQKAWLSSQSFAKKYGFAAVDTTDTGYELLALSFDGTKPSFAANAKLGRIEQKELTIYYDMQCPFIEQRIRQIEAYCDENAIPCSMVRVDFLRQAKELPCVFNNWALFYQGAFVSVNQMGVDLVKKLLAQQA